MNRLGAKACLLILLVGGCDVGTANGPNGSRADSSKPRFDPRPGDTVEGLDAATTEVYLRKIAPMIVGRTLSPEERAQIKTQGGAAIRPLLEAWGAEPGFHSDALALMETKLAVGGSPADDIDYELPGNTILKVVQEELPWSTVITADSCFDKAGVALPCDTGAPYNAGVLTTRAYMAGHVGRFNLSRARNMLAVFACRSYPLDDDLEPRADKQRLIPMFRAEKPAEQTVDAAKGGFGNGLACYSCHGQFSLHAQLFVKFDNSGKWAADATGIQSTAEGAQLGESLNALMASHFVAPTDAASERSQWFGQPVENLAQAARVLSESDEFAECAAQNALEWGLGLPNGNDVSPGMLKAVGDAIRARNPDPTYQEIVAETFAYPTVVFAALTALLGDDE